MPKLKKIIKWYLVVFFTILFDSLLIAGCAGVFSLLNYFISSQQYSLIDQIVLSAISILFSISILIHPLKRALYDILQLIIKTKMLYKDIGHDLAEKEESKKTKKLMASNNSIAPQDSKSKRKRLSGKNTA